MTLFELRQSRDLSLREAARALGIHAQDLSKYERAVEPVPDVIQASMAEVYKITREELAPMLPSREAIIERSQEMTNFSVVLKAVAADAETQGLTKGHGGAASIPCPVCGGTVRYQVSSSNGHYLAKCSTEGCIRFMS